MFALGESPPTSSGTPLVSWLFTALQPPRGATLTYSCLLTLAAEGGIRNATNPPLPDTGPSAALLGLLLLPFSLTESHRAPTPARAYPCPNEAPSAARPPAPQGAGAGLQTLADSPGVRRENRGSWRDARPVPPVRDDFGPGPRLPALFLRPLHSV